MKIALNVLPQFKHVIFLLSVVNLEPCSQKFQKTDFKNDEVFKLFLFLVQMVRNKTQR